jgi:hypothetical protein
MVVVYFQACSGSGKKQPKKSSAWALHNSIDEVWQ